jgi:general stress protein 13
MKVGDIVLVKVTGIADYGFFIEKDGYTGLCHISEVSNNFVEDVSKFVSVGEEIYVLILDVNEVRKHLRVSIKDIYYINYDDKNRIKETRKGFLPLKEMLPIWIDEKIREYEKEE